MCFQPLRSCGGANKTASCITLLNDLGKVVNLWGEGANQLVFQIRQDSGNSKEQNWAPFIPRVRNRISLMRRLFGIRTSQVCGKADYRNSWSENVATHGGLPGDKTSIVPRPGHGLLSMEKTSFVEAERKDDTSHMKVQSPSLS